MQKLIGVLVLIGIGGWLIGCALNEGTTGLSVQELGLGIVNGCGDVQGAAVAVTLHQDANPLNGFKVRYRINNDNWTPDQETSEASFLIRGPAGKYEIEVRKAGYPVQSAIVVVPQEENCEILQQDLALSVAAPFCSSPESILVMNIVTRRPEENGLEIVLNGVNGNQGNGLDITLKTPTIQQKLPCPDPNLCHLELNLRDVGNYIVEMAGIPDYRKMMVIDNVVRYKYTDLRINMIDEENRLKTFVSEGLSNMSITIPYEYGSRSCPEVLLDAVSVATTHIQPPEQNTVEIREHRPWMIENTPSARCPAPAVNGTNRVPVDFDVLLPAGTNIDNVRVEYWLNNDWQQAGCTHTNGYQCTAVYPNPLHGDKYQVRTLINGQEYLGTNISLGNKCLIFE